MKHTAVVLLAFLLAIQATLSRPHQAGSVKERAERYASLHPKNTDGIPEERCQVLYAKGTPHESNSPLNAVVDEDYLWPDNTLYYTIMPDSYTPEQIAEIEEAIDELEAFTSVDGQPCVHIAPRTTEPDYVYVQNYSGCSSYIGRIGGPQRLSLVDSCVARNGTIMHEFLHALGFYHEQSRSDRDEYVEINWDNIEVGYWNNFRRLNESDINLLGTGYDYGSCMHYSAYAFAIDDSIPTIIPTYNETVEIGQRVNMSHYDIERVQLLYKCITPAESVYFKHIAV